MSTALMTPPVPPMSTASPTSNGRSTSSSTPAAMSATVSFSARPTASPAAPSAANSPLVSTPSLPSAATSTTRSSNSRVSLAKSGIRVGLTRRLRSLARRTAEPAQPATSQPAIEINSALPMAIARCSRLRFACLS